MKIKKILELDDRVYVFAGKNMYECLNTKNHVDLLRETYSTNYFVKKNVLYHRYTHDGGRLKYIEKSMLNPLEKIKNMTPYLKHIIRS